MQNPAQKIRYQALGPLMAGQGSRAFLGLEISETSPARPVVMVWVPGEAARDAEQRAQILRETQRAVTLEHPNITRVYGLASLDEGLARVVEFSDGESLRGVLDRAQRLPARFAALVVADAARGAHFAHLAGNDDGSPLLHGDLRPETLMVTYAGVTKVAGYGALSVAPKEVDGKRVNRRRLYSAPEQNLGGRGAITVQTDVFLLGLILYEALTGIVPFEGTAEAAPLTPLQIEGVPEIPPALVPILKSATAMRAADRYATALAFRDAVERAIGPLASHQEFAGYLGAFFPEEDPARLARRQMIDTGVADHARRVWETRGETVAVPKEPTPAAGPVPKLNGAAAATAPSSPAPVQRPRPTPLQVAAFPPRKKGVSPAWVAALLLVMGVGVYLGTQLGRAPAPPPAAPRALPIEPPPPPPTTAALPAPPTSGTASVAPSGAAPTGTEAPIAPSPTAAATPPPAPVAPKATEPTKLDLSVTPPVNVYLGGKSVGRTPLSLTLNPGRHMLRLVDGEKGINVTRTVAVNRGGTTRHFIELGKGLLSVRVPDGAVVNLDGKVIGNQTIRDLSIFEGSHRLVVTVGTAKWQQAFTLGKDQSMDYEVTAEPQR